MTLDDLNKRLSALYGERQQLHEQLTKIGANISAYNGAIQEVERWIAEASSVVELVVEDVIDAVIPAASIPEASVQTVIVAPDENPDATITTSPMDAPITPTE